MSDDAPRSMSVVVRVRRTTVEEVHVSVPITDAVVTDDHLDGAKIVAEANTDMSMPIGSLSKVL